MLRVIQEAHLEILQPKAKDLGDERAWASAYITDFRGRNILLLIHLYRPNFQLTHFSPSAQFSIIAAVPHSTSSTLLDIDLQRRIIIF